MYNTHHSAALRVICLLLCFLQTTVVTGCSEQDTVSETLSETETTVTETTAETERIFPHEQKDFEGKNFHVLADEEISGNNLYYDDLLLTESTGEVLNDAVFERNNLVSEFCNIEYSITSDPSAASKLQQTAAAGDPVYDAVTLRFTNAYSRLNECVDLNGLENLSLESSWWDHKSVESLSIAGFLKMLTGDIFYKHYDGVEITLFNKEMQEAFGIEDLYETVREGRWTIDKMGELCHLVTTDLDGNGTMDRYDRWGYACQAGDFGYGLLNGSEILLMEKDENDIPMSDLDIEKASSVFEKFYSFFLDSTFDIGKDAGYQQHCAFWVFPEGRSLLYWAMPRYIEWQLRDIEFDYGILPNPKYDEAQENYYSAVNSYHSYCYMIPISAAKPEDSAYIMDVLAFHGEELIKPAYYDICLKRKMSQDEESSEMLDIIFANTVYDLGVYADFGGLYSAINSSLASGQEVTLASLYASRKKEIDQTIEQYVASVTGN